MDADHQKSAFASKRGVPKCPLGKLYVLHFQTDDFFKTKSCGKQVSGDDYVPVPYGGQFGTPLHDVEKGFAPMYGSRTKFYGIIDFFFESAYINGFTPGLQNAYIGAFCKPNGKFQCSATYHYLATATELSRLNRTLGHSIELQASYRFSKDISLGAGYTQMQGTETMDRLKQGEGKKRANWGWFSLVISPNIFTTKW